MLWVCSTGVCRKGQVEINERDIDEACTSTCPSKYLVSIKHGCSFIDHCRIKDSGWKHWFTRCTHCECDCFIPCGKSDTHHQFYEVLSTLTLSNLGHQKYFMLKLRCLLVEIFI